MTMMTNLSLSIQERDGRRTKAEISARDILLAGYTGRDRQRVLEHVRELELLGVAPPERVPMVYVVPGFLATTGSRITVEGTETSGEVEFYLIEAPEGLLVGLGSDHTDRKEEAIDVASSKTRCPKIMSSTAWRFADLKDHWDRIELRSWSVSGLERRLYQDGRFDSFLSPDAILDEVRAAGHSLDGNVVFSGTLPLLHGFEYPPRFEAEAYDPMLNRRLSIAYQVTVIGR